MTEIDGGYNISYLSTYDFLKKVRNVRQVTLRGRLFTKKGTCYHCNGQMVNKQLDRSIMNDDWTEFRFKFYNYCDCCGSLYFKDNRKILFIIEQSVINLRKAKINRLMNRKK